jgi:ATPase subunit of ABC transporter with duplicated ATPase domains
MSDISVQGIVKSFGEDINILDGLTFEVLEGEHVGLIGRNGCGKTTLLRLIVGEILPDEGKIVLGTGKSVGLISQIPKYPAGYTAEDVLKTAHQKLYAMKDRMEELEKLMTTDASRSVMDEYDRVSARFMALGGYDTRRFRNTVANGLSITASQREQLFDSLSGGEKTRVNLARLILEDTDILLLDEPTNHLDIEASEWLEDYLSKFKGTVLTVSHDRYFLDRSVTRTIEIEDGKASFYSGNYSFFLEEKQRRLEEQLKRYEKEQAELQRLEEARRRLYQWGTGNERLMKKSQAIQSRMERLERTERPKFDKKMTNRFGEREFRGDEVLVMKGVTKSFGDRTLFRDLEFTVRGGERIALIGDNGTGKSTLIKLIMNEEKTDSGFVRIGPSIKTAYLPQIVKFQNPERSVLDTMLYEAKLTPQAARNRLGSFLFTGEEVFRPVGQLSGGEQSRLRLCILMKDDINFLILDEPTNHLDIAAREWIESAVEEYEGTLLFVSHDRYFINRFATRIWELKDGEIRDFVGSYEKYRSVKAMEAAGNIPEKAQKEKKGKPKKAKKVSNEKLLARLEREIGALEKDLERIEAEESEYSTDYEKLMEISAKRQETEAELEVKYGEWEELADSE